MKINVAESVAHPDREAPDEVSGKHAVVAGQNLGRLGDEGLVRRRRRLPQTRQRAQTKGCQRGAGIRCLSIRHVATLSIAS